MPDLTPKLGIKKPLGNETVTRAAFNENWDIIDQNTVADKGGVPSIQAGLDAEKPSPGTVGRLYVATDTKIIYQDTGSAWEKRGVVKWDDIEGKPSSFQPVAHTHNGSEITSKVSAASAADTVPWTGVSGKPSTFTPSAHATSHASGGSDQLTPADIGAASQTALDAHANRTDNPHNVTAAQIGANNILAQLLTVDGPGSGLDADTLDGKHAGDFVVLSDLSPNHRHTGAMGDGSKIGPDAFDTAVWPAFRAYASTSQLLYADVWTKIAFQTEIYDQGSIYDSAIYRFKAPANGFYIVGAYIDFDIDISITANKYRAVALHVNGSQNSRIAYCATPGNTPLQIGGSVLLKLNANDYVEVYAVSEFGVYVNSASSKTYFFAARLA